MSEFFRVMLTMCLAAIPVLVISSAAVAVLQGWLTPERTRQLMGRGGALGYLVAVLVGIITPFSAASGMPLAAGLVECGVPLGVLTTFLITSPFVSVVPLITVSGALGLDGALVYIAGVSLLGVVTGMLFDRLGLGASMPLPQAEAAAPAAALEPGQTRAGLTVRRSWAMILRVSPYLAAGMVVAALVYQFLPGELMAAYIGKDAWWAVPLAAALGIPVMNLPPVLFPISLVLLNKGVGLAAVLAFSMAASGLKVPESIFLGRLLGPRVLVWLLGAVAVGVLGAGFLAAALT